MNVVPGSKAHSMLDPDCDSVEMYGTVDEYETSIVNVPRESLIVLAALHCHDEVCNGGLRQFFRNTTGILAPESADGLELLGFSASAAALRDAMALSSTPYPRRRAERHRAIEELEYPGGDPKLITEYEPDINAIINKMHIATRKPIVRPFDSMNTDYYGGASVGEVGLAADRFVTPDDG